MSDYLITANTIFNDLKENKEQLFKEAALIDEAKCYLVNFHNLDDFEYGGAYVYGEDGNYYISYDGCTYVLDTNDEMILRYNYN